VYFKFFEEANVRRYSSAIEEKETKRKLSGLKMVFVCEEQSEVVQVELEGLANKIYAELDFENMLGFLKQSEANMYKNYCKLFFYFFIFFRITRHKMRFDFKSLN
jgi:hypothetical protein